MRFQKSDPQPFSGRDRRIVFLFLGVLAVFFVVQLVSKPEFRRAWSGAESADSGKPVDQLGTPDDGALADDEIFIAQPESNSSDQAEAALAQPDEPDRRDGLPGIPSSALSAVRDHTIGVRAAERSAFYSVLRAMRQRPASDLHPLAERIPYTMVMAEPARHRGRLVLIEGRLRRLVKRRPLNEQAMGEVLYDAWIFTNDSGRNPWHVVCSAVPEDLRPAEAYSGEPPVVRIVGTFFKTEGYESKGDGQAGATLHLAPLLLAGELEVVPVAQAGTRDIASEMVPWLWWFAIAVGAVLAIVLWNFAVSDWTFRHTRAHHLLHGDGSPDFRSVTAVPTGEMLQDLSQDPDPGWAEP